jgi:hypothetical protein
MNQARAKYLFIKYQSLYQIYKERADSYRAMAGRDVIVYSDLIARLALRKANYYEGMIK